MGTDDWRRHSRAIWGPTIGDVTSKLREHFLRIGVVPTIESANKVIAEANRILSRCVSPSQATSARTGLVCGYVQSGKTASITAVSALAKDNRYRIIVLIAGVTTNLLAQTKDRLQTHLRAAAAEWTWLMLTNPTQKKDRAAVETLVREWTNDWYEEEDRRTLFITVMKNHSQLRKLADLLASVELSNAPAIIFDDEADQASLNTRPGDATASTTYTMISDLRQTLPWHTYLQYTATPQAPLLITRIDSLSADFAELVSPGEGYTGGHQFFGEQTAYVEDIPEADIYRDGQLPLEPPQSLLRAMQVFFVGVAAGRLGPMLSHRSMLVHPSKRTATHQLYYNWVNDLKAHWHEVLLHADELDRADLAEDFRQAHVDLNDTCGELPPFDKIRAKLPVAMNQTAVTLVNSTDGREVPWNNGYSHILVGGEKLGRGYTVRGLTVTYMPRSPGGWTADTVQQRARFFGYHADHIGYCRVYLHPDVRDIYVAYVRHEQDMRDRLAEHGGQPLREWRRLFYLDQRLQPTRKNVVLSPYLRPRLTQGWFAPRVPHVSPGEGTHNAGIVRRLQQLEFQAHDTYQQHYWALLRLQDVFDHILVPLSYLDYDDALGLCVVNCNLKTVLEQDDDARCLVYLMDRGHLRLRRLQNGFIPQLFQGRSSAGATSYPGDRAFSHRTLSTVQVHMLRVTDDEQTLENVPAIAVKLATQEDVLVQDE